MKGGEKMIKGIKIDIAMQTITISRAFSKKASIVGSIEYEAFLKVKQDNPNYNIVVKKIKKNVNKKTYSGLTYDYMRSYIMTHEDNKNIINVLHEFEEMIMIADCHSAGYKYPIIKNWFLNRYTEIKKYGMPQIDENDIPSVEDIVRNNAA